MQIINYLLFYFQRTDCKKYAYYRKMAYTYKNRLIVENRNQNKCREKLGVLREKELLHEDKIRFDNNMLMEETCGGCQVNFLNFNLGVR